VQHSNSTQLIFLGITKRYDLNEVWVWVGSLYSISNDLPVPPIQVCRVEKWGAFSAHILFTDFSLKWVLSKLQVELSQSK